MSTISLCAYNHVPNGPGMGWGSHRCGRRGVIEEDGKLWCKQHAPSAVKARQAESDRRGDEAWQKRRQEFMGPSAIQLLRGIAGGRNDAREAAIEWLKGFDA